MLTWDDIKSLPTELLKEPGTNQIVAHVDTLNFREISTTLRRPCKKAARAAATTAKQLEPT